MGGLWFEPSLITHESPGKNKVFALPSVPTRGLAIRVTWSNPAGPRRAFQGNTKNQLGPPRAPPNTPRKNIYIFYYRGTYSRESPKHDTVQLSAGTSHQHWHDPHSECHARQTRSEHSTVERSSKRGETNTVQGGGGQLGLYEEKAPCGGGGVRSARAEKEEKAVAEARRVWRARTAAKVGVQSTISIRGKSTHKTLVKICSKRKYFRVVLTKTTHCSYSL